MADTQQQQVPASAVADPSSEGDALVVRLSVFDGTLSKMLNDVDDFLVKLGLSTEPANMTQKSENGEHGDASSLQSYEAQLSLFMERFEIARLELGHLISAMNNYSVASNLKFLQSLYVKLQRAEAHLRPRPKFRFHRCDASGPRVRAFGGAGAGSGVAGTHTPAEGAANEVKPTTRVTLPPLIALGAPLSPAAAGDGPRQVAASGDGDIVIRGVKDKCIIMGPGETLQRDCSLSDLTNCCVLLLDEVKALRATRIERCTIWAKRVVTSALLYECVSSVVALSAQQLRIHESRDVQFYVSTTALPVIERTREVSFAPMFLTVAEDTATAFPKETAEQGDVLDGEPQGPMSPSQPADLGIDVLDFDWHKRRASPNWSVIPVAARRAPVHLLLTRSHGAAGTIAPLPPGSADATTAFTSLGGWCVSGVPTHILSGRERVACDEAQPNPSLS